MSKPAWNSKSEAQLHRGQAHRAAGGFTVSAQRLGGRRGTGAAGHSHRDGEGLLDRGDTLI